VSETPVLLPRGFSGHVGNMGIKDGTDDFVLIVADATCPAAAVFTRSRFVGPSVSLSRAHVADGRLRAFAVIAKNANVATGPQGEADAAEVAARAARVCGSTADDVLVASTGVIGRPYPMPRVRSYLDRLAGAAGAVAEPDARRLARGMMTTDTVPKVAEASVMATVMVPATAAGGRAGGPARIVGIAKGVGMIEPDMATLITLFCTDAAIGSQPLDQAFRRVIDRTFNSLSIDTDTSTSDTAAIMAGGAAGAVDPEAFEAALLEVALSLTKQIARDGEGATRLIEVVVDAARDEVQARRVAKAIVNSPLVKTAVHGADPNWGRVAMAVGKCSDDTDIDQGRVTIRFGCEEVYPHLVDEAGLEALASYLRSDEVVIHVSLATGSARWTVYGCDLSDQYVRINADYTT
jgi:glutamate N-acetyltransferase/amino-acid N-acetyltransferase